MTTCTEIPFCDKTIASTPENYMFNQCAKCETGYIHFYNDTTKLIEFNKCVPIISKILSNDYELGNNCLAANDTNCVICQEAMSLDKDGFCQQFKDNNCEGVSMRIMHNNILGLVNGIPRANQIIHWAIKRNGCDNCRSSFINMSFDTEFNSCIATVERENILYYSEPATTEPTPPASKVKISKSLLEQGDLNYPEFRENKESKEDHKRLLEALKNSQIVMLTSSTTIPNCKDADIIKLDLCVTCEANYKINPKSRECAQVKDCQTQSYIYGKHYL